MEFPELDFDAMNEADVREEIIAPLLRYLGYRAGTQNNIIREQALNYPKLQLGRKKANDPLVSGRADYICEVQGRVRWGIEAKPPSEVLGEAAEQQSWSYANHPEVRAVYHCTSNGREFRIYRTNRGPTAAPIFSCRYEELLERLTTIENLLAPESLLRDHPDVQIDTGEPLGPGLRSLARLLGGSIVIERSTLNVPAFEGFAMAVTTGSVERADDGTLRAYLETLVLNDAHQKLNERLGLHFLRLSSTDTRVSIDPACPTVLVGSSSHVLPAGEKVLNLLDWTEHVLPTSIPVQVATRAAGALVGRRFAGLFEAALSFPSFPVQISGRFDVNLG